MRSVPRAPPVRQSKRWVFTLNNYSQLEETELSILGNDAGVEFLVYGRELAETGTPHLQGYIIFRTNRRFNAAKAELPEGCHIEVAVGSTAQNVVYCSKEHDVVTFGSIPNPPGRNNKHEAFRAWILEQPTKPTMVDVASGPFIEFYFKYEHTRNLIDAIYPPPVSDSVTTLRSYQQELFDRLAGQPDTRKIIFVVDPVGNSGKSFFADYLLLTRPNDVQILSAGRRDDISYAVDDRKSIFIFDLPRSSQEYVPYVIAEQLKDRRVFSNKYQSRMKHISTAAWVIIMTNEYPDMSRLSNDRYEIVVWNNEN